MNTHDFDDHADSYRQTLDDALSIGGGDSLYYAERKFSALRLFYQERSIAKPSFVLDFGCGTGTNLSFLRELFSEAKLYGADVSSRSLEVARKEAIDNCHLTLYAGDSLPFDPATFDMVLVSNVLHHIEPSDRAATLQEIANSMKPGALIAVFEHNPKNPVTRKIVRDCPFDVGVTLVNQSELKSTLGGLGFRIIDLWHIIFFPAALKRFNASERSLRRLPLGAQYVMFAEWLG